MMLHARMRQKIFSNPRLAGGNERSLDRWEGEKKKLIERSAEIDFSIEASYTRIPTGSRFIWCGKHEN
jgi:hypothetical protein